MYLHDDHLEIKLVVLYCIVLYCIVLYCIPAYPPGGDTSFGNGTDTLINDGLI